MLNLLALYRGQTLQDVRTVTVTSDPQVIKQFVETVLQSRGGQRDPSLKAIANGERKALEKILTDLGGGNG